MGTRRPKKGQFLAKKRRCGLVMNRYDPYGTGCSVCKQRTHHLGAKYCPSCAYKQGKCSICGKKILDTSAYKQSSR
ncbi:unnamed protein product [Pneumocystis jirovecii]|uniref:Cysteine-rich PDZ-binding protein n=1 Tax=Pneumocystis jirovecii TaxID=42068 RepID=L0PE38_PNEJI|nr:unnamed protein product [Pneumocystis jirovecii]